MSSESSEILTKVIGILLGDLEGVSGVTFAEVGLPLTASVLEEGVGGGGAGEDADEASNPSS